jgi:formylglycine-generating enzyme required for sulfatase activity
VLYRFALFLVLAASIAVLAPLRAEERPDREFQECRNCPVMVAVPAGRFVMGSPQSEAGRFDAEGPQHVVSLKAFALGKFDVTSEQFLSFLKDTGYQPKPCNPILNMSWRSPGDGLAYTPTEFEPPRWPAVCLDWHDAEAYVAWLNKQVRKEHPVLGNRSGPYRLPSEAEWEYAARAGTTTARWWGDGIGSGHANCNGCGSTYDFHVLSNVDSFKPNLFGLYGMLGNVWQWTEDCWHKSYLGAPKDGRPWMENGCTRHVLRGGSWDNVPAFVRSATRTGGEPGGGEFDYSRLAGFRVARDLP